jgi:hypothetical protein
LYVVFSQLRLKTPLWAKRQIHFDFDFDLVLTLGVPVAADTQRQTSDRVVHTPVTQSAASGVAALSRHIAKRAGEIGQAQALEPIHSVVASPSVQAGLRLAFICEKERERNFNSKHLTFSSVRRKIEAFQNLVKIRVQGPLTSRHNSILNEITNM